MTILSRNESRISALREKGKRDVLRLSPAHAEYLEHSSHRILGSSGASELRLLIYQLLTGALPFRPLRAEDQQTGKTFSCFNRRRIVVETALTEPEKRQLVRFRRERGELPLEAVIRFHGRGVYYIENHDCDKWCSSTCPGKRISKKRVG
jgi:hypothetical protein